MMSLTCIFLHFVYNEVMKESKWGMISLAHGFYALYVMIGLGECDKDAILRCDHMG